MSERTSASPVYEEQPEPLSDRERHLLKRIFSDWAEVPSRWFVDLKSALEANPPILGKQTLGAQLRTLSAVYVTSLPSNPANGQEAILVDSLTAPTYAWHLRFNASSVSAYKWEYVGGTPIVSGPSGTVNTTTTGYTALTSGPSITVPRDGDYVVDTGVTGMCNGSFALNGTYFGQARATFGGLAGNVLELGCPVQWAKAAMSQSQVFTARVAGHIVTIEMQNDRANASGGTSTWNLGWLKVIPQRLG